MGGESRGVREPARWRCLSLLRTVAENVAAPEVLLVVVESAGLGSRAGSAGGGIRLITQTFVREEESRLSAKQGRLGCTRPFIINEQYLICQGRQETVRVWSPRVREIAAGTRMFEDSAMSAPSSIASKTRQEHADVAVSLLFAGDVLVDAGGGPVFRQRGKAAIP